MFFSTTYLSNFLRYFISSLHLDTKDLSGDFLSQGFGRGILFIVSGKSKCNNQNINTGLYIANKRGIDSLLIYKMYPHICYIIHLSMYLYFRVGEFTSAACNFIKFKQEDIHKVGFINNLNLFNYEIWSVIDLLYFWKLQIKQTCLNEKKLSNKISFFDHYGCSFSNGNGLVKISIQKAQLKKNRFPFQLFFHLILNAHK